MSAWRGRASSTNEIAMKRKGKRPTAEASTRPAGAVREAATRAEGVARRLLRRTRLLRGPVNSVNGGARDTGHHSPASAGDTPVKLIPPRPDRSDARASDASASDERSQSLAREVAALRARAERAERAEHAAAWLRARLRAERARRPTGAIDASALAADLARDLARLRYPRPDEIRRIVERALTAQGLPAGGAGAPAGRGGGGRDVVPAAPPGWSAARREAVGRQVIARAPDVTDPLYVYRALALVAERGRLTVPGLLRASGLDSGMAKRRLRLAVEALAGLGALKERDGAYTLNPDYHPSPRHGAHPQRPGGRPMSG